MNGFMGSANAQSARAEQPSADAPEMKRSPLKVLWFENHNCAEVNTRQSLRKAFAVSVLSVGAHECEAHFAYHSVVRIRAILPPKVVVSAGRKAAALVLQNGGEPRRDEKGVDEVQADSIYLSK